jgi:AcrR family transcriptional regulator
MRQEGDLARTHEGEPGLPRGRSRLPREKVRATQRERLLRAAIAAVAEIGFRDVTVADIVRRARVSRAAFYVHFSDKEECFLTATREGGQVMADRIAGAARRPPPGAEPEEALRAGIAAFLQFLATEPAFARVFYIDMPAAGPRAARRLQEAGHRFARFNQAWHERARCVNPDWPAVPYRAYYALAGATAELVRAEVVKGNVQAVTGLEDTLVALHLAVLAARPWPPSDAAPPAHPVPLGVRRFEPEKS